MINDGIDHVVVLMMENRSFDHMLGGLKGATPDLVSLDGVDLNSVKYNYNSLFNKIDQASTLPSRLLPNDIGHEYDNVKAQMGPNFDVREMGGFVLDYQHKLEKEGTPYSNDDLYEIMAFWRYQSLPALHKLAASYTVCDRWFSPLPGPTWPNRIFMHSGTSLGHVNMPGDGVFASLFFSYGQNTIYDAIQSTNPKNGWKIYYDYFSPQAWILSNLRAPEYDSKFVKGLDLFKQDCAQGALPSYSFIEPNFYHNCQHPPSDILAGDKLIADVYNALRQSPNWGSTLFVILYDEHGGFYDHVTPTPAVPPDNHVAPNGFRFDRYGVRVPAVLISPLIGRGVCHTEFDHTSVLRYVLDKWAPKYDLGNRVRAAKSIGDVLLKAPRLESDYPEIVGGTGPTFVVGSSQPDDNQKIMAVLQHVKNTERSAGKAAAQTFANDPKAVKAFVAALNTTTTVETA